MPSKAKSDIFKKIITKLPAPFYLIIGIALGVACLLFVMMSVLKPYLQKPETVQELYPRYTQMSALSSNEIKAQTYSSLRGQWATEKDGTVFLVIFFPKGQFSWQVFEKKRPAYTLYAGGPYAPSQQPGEILLSSQVENGLLIPGYRPYYRVNDMRLGEQLFRWQMSSGKLILAPLEPDNLPENVKNLWYSFSQQGPIVFSPVVGAEKSR